MTRKRRDAGGVYPAFNVWIDGHRTSMRFSPIEREALIDICRFERLSRHEYCSQAVNQSDRVDANNTAKVRDRMTRYLLESWRMHLDKPLSITA